MSTRLHEVYAKWERRTEVPRNLDSNAPRLSLGGEKQFLFIKLKEKQKKRIIQFVT